MAKINKTCKNCNESFLADERELKRGNAVFCSISCGTSWRNNNVAAFISILCICKNCGNSFTSTNNRAKYCSDSCKQKNYRLKKRSGNMFDIRLEKEIKKYPCEICGWDLSTRDSHHITPVSVGGKSTIDNLISVCPNHHRMIHNNLLSQDYLNKIVKSRTISSSLERLILLINSKELGANSGY